MFVLILASIYFLILSPLAQERRREFFPHLHQKQEKLTDCFLVNEERIISEDYSSLKDTSHLTLLSDPQGEIIKIADRRGVNYYQLICFKKRNNSPCRIIGSENIIVKMNCMNGE